MNKEKVTTIGDKVQEPCHLCGKTLREQSTLPCLEITCYRQYLIKT